MSQYYQDLDRAGGFDYMLHQIPTLGAIRLRGPPVDWSGRYVVFVGAAQTFGRFATSPFPSLIGTRLNIPALNLGVGGAGPRHFEKPAYLDIINRAETVVLQVLSGRSASNSMFDNSASGGQRGRVGEEKSLVRAEEFFSSYCKSASQLQIENIVEETRADYLSAFIRLLRNIVVPKILFWCSMRSTEYAENYKNLPFSVLGTFPQLVNQRMVTELRKYADEYVECVGKQGIPQTLWRSDHAIDGTRLNQGVLENTYYPSPAMHVAAADVLEGSCRRFLGRYRVYDSKRNARKVVIVASERTGTNLLIGLLNQYDGCLIGNELFNGRNIEGDVLPWPDLANHDRSALLALRRRDPVAFWETLYATSASKDLRVVGFKLMYFHGLAFGGLLDHFAADKSVAIVHVKRRNLLRRLVSERQAQVAGKWALSATAPRECRPPVTLQSEEVVRSIRKIEEHQRTYDSIFSGHRIIQIVYEDLAQRPMIVAERVANFLGLERPSRPLTVRDQKTGDKKLASAIINYETLRAELSDRESLFDD